MGASCCVSSTAHDVTQFRESRDDDSSYISAANVEFREGGPVQRPPGLREQSSINNDTKQAPTASHFLPPLAPKRDRLQTTDPHRPVAEEPSDSLREVHNAEGLFMTKTQSSHSLPQTADDDNIFPNVLSPVAALNNTTLSYERNGPSDSPEEHPPLSHDHDVSSQPSYGARSPTPVVNHDVHEVPKKVLIAEDIVNCAEVGDIVGLMDLISAHGGECLTWRNFLLQPTGVLLHPDCEVIDTSADHVFDMDIGTFSAASSSDSIVTGATESDSDDEKATQAPSPSLLQEALTSLKQRPQGYLPVSQRRFIFLDMDMKAYAPFHVCARNNHIDVIEFMIKSLKKTVKKSKSTIQIRDINEIVLGRAPIHEAILSKHHRTVYSIIHTAGASLTYPGAVITRHSVASAVETAPKVSILFAERAVSIRAPGEASVQYLVVCGSCLQNSVGICRSDRGVPDMKARTVAPVHLASEVEAVTNGRQTHTSDGLVAAFCPMCCVEEQPLHLAVRTGDVQMVMLLLETVVTAICNVLGVEPTRLPHRHGTAHSNEKDSPLNRWKLFLAERKKHNTKTYAHVVYDLGLCDEGLTMLETFVNMRRFRDGFTALHIASEMGRMDLVRLLVDHQANPKQKVSSFCYPPDTNTVSPADVAQRNRFPDIAMYLKCQAASSKDTQKLRGAVTLKTKEKKHSGKKLGSVDKTNALRLSDSDDDFEDVEDARRYLGSIVRSFGTRLSTPPIQDKKNTSLAELLEKNRLRIEKHSRSSGGASRPSSASRPNSASDKEPSSAFLKTVEKLSEKKHVHDDKPRSPSIGIRRATSLRAGLPQSPSSGTLPPIRGTTKRHQ